MDLGFPDILYETSRELVIYKSPGMASELSSQGSNSLKSKLQQFFPEADIQLPHRLDRITRGLMLVAKDRESVAWHSSRIEQREWDKYYIAKIDELSSKSDSQLSSLSGVQKAYLKRDKMKAKVVRSGGKPSFIEILSWKPHMDGHNYILIKNITGRFHQIRAIMANLGCPLTADPLYHPHPDRGSFFLESCALGFVPFGCHGQEWVLESRAPGNLFNEELQLLKN